MHPRPSGAWFFCILALLSSSYVAGEDLTVHHTAGKDGTLPHSWSAHTPQVEMYCNITGTQMSGLRGFHCIFCMS
jgi:hypothetical protein